MGEKESLVERNGCLNELNSTYSWNPQLPNIRIDTFEKKQHYNVPCAISCQGTFIIEFH